MKCPKCQTENPSDSKYCKECAAPLTSPEEIAVSHTKTLETPKEELSTGSTFAGRYQIIEELAAENPDNIEYEGYLGALAARRGRREIARKISEELKNIERPYLFGKHTFWRACIASLLSGLYLCGKEALLKYFKAVTGRELTPGIIAVIQSFGSKINLHPHLPDRPSYLSPMWGSDEDYLLYRGS